MHTFIEHLNLLICLIPIFIVIYLKKESNVGPNVIFDHMKGK